MLTSPSENASIAGGGAWFWLSQPALVMADSGQQFSNGYLGSSAHDTYKGVVDTALARPPQADIQATSRRIGNRIHFDVQLTNLSGASLSSSNAATIHGLSMKNTRPWIPMWITLHNASCAPRSRPASRRHWRLARR